MRLCFACDIWRFINVYLIDLIWKRLGMRYKHVCRPQMTHAAAFCTFCNSFWYRCWHWDVIVNQWYHNGLLKLDWGVRTNMSVYLYILTYVCKDSQNRLIVLCKLHLPKSRQSPKLYVICLKISPPLIPFPPPSILSSAISRHSSLHSLPMLQT